MLLVLVLFVFVLVQSFVVMLVGQVFLEKELDIVVKVYMSVNGVLFDIVKCRLEVEFELFLVIVELKW